jgi:hypothetical protein
MVIELCGILRLARVLAGSGKQVAGRLTVEQAGNPIVIFVPGYSELRRQTEKVAKDKNRKDRRGVLASSTWTLRCPQRPYGKKQEYLLGGLHGSTCAKT